MQSRVPNLESLAQVGLEICSIVCQKLQASRDLGHAHFQEKLFVLPLGIPDTSSIPNLKSLAQVVFEIYLSIYLKSQDYGDVGAEAQQGRLTM